VSLEEFVKRGVARLKAAREQDEAARLFASAEQLERERRRMGDAYSKRRKRDGNVYERRRRLDPGAG